LNIDWLKPRLAHATPLMLLHEEDTLGELFIAGDV
jgi:hypothetical protein